MSTGYVTESAVLAIPLPEVIGPECNGMLMTIDEYETHEDWDPLYRYELVNGVLIVSPVPGDGESDWNDELGYLLRSYRDHHAQGVALDQTLPEQEILTSVGWRRADRAIWTGLGRKPVQREDIPTIAIEFVSESTRDRRRDYVEKRQEYANTGVKEYWVIDRFDRTMTVFVGTAKTYIVKETDVYTTELLPGFELPLERLLRLADSSTTD